MKKIYIIMGCAACVSLLVFFNFSDSKKEKELFKPLLQRKGPISTTSEWLNVQESIITLQSQIRQNPGDTKNKLLLALAYMQEARSTGEHPYYYPAAMELIEDVLDEEKFDNTIIYEALVAKASVLLSLHKFSEALVIGEEALKINSNNSSVYGVMCDAHVELGNYKEAVKMADKMVSIRPDLRSYSRVSYLREIHGDMQGSIEAMKLAVSAGFPGLEQTVWTRVTLGQLYERNGDLDNAEVQYRLSVEEYPYYAFAVAGLARLEHKKKNYKEAVKLYNEASDVIPEFSFKEDLASIYKEMGKSDEAEKATEELLEMLEEDADAGHGVNLELANIYIDLKKDYNEALSYALKEYKSRPENIDVCKTLAHIYYKKGDYNKASQYLKVANKTNKQDPSLLCLSGLVNCKTGKKDDGLKLIKRSLEQDPFQNNDLTDEGKKIISGVIARAN